jgi:hypothetical protein
MKDFRGLELGVGDKIAYMRRHSSSMRLKQTTIRGFKKRKHYWNDEEFDVAVCDNPNWKPKDESKPWRGWSPKTVTLGVEPYIILLEKASDAAV